MSKINADINDDLDDTFRRLIFEKLGGKKGTLKQALEESIQLWIDQHQ